MRSRWQSLRRTSAALVASALLCAASASCTPDPPSCADSEVLHLVKELAVGKTRQTVSDDEGRKIDWFLEVGGVRDEGRFGARAHCSATVSISAAAMAAIGHSQEAAASNSSDDQSLEPLDVRYDIILPMDQSTVSVVVVESQNIPPARAQRLDELLEAMPSSTVDQAGQASP